jgi:putative transposase
MENDVTTAESNRNDRSTSDRSHADVAIVFGSAMLSPAKRPASVRAVCEAIGLPRSTYYYQSHRSLSAIEFEHKIVLRLHELRDLYPNDGYRRMTQQLQLEGFHVNRKRIARLMQIHGLSVKSPRPSYFIPHARQPQPVIPNLLTTARITGPNQAWLAEITYVHIRSGLVYAAGVIDVWTREVVGYAVAIQISNRLASIALHSAIRAHRSAPGCIHHSICGTQYASRSYRRLLREYGLTPSVGALVDGTAPSRVIERPSYETWGNVLRSSKEFIRTVYTREWLELLLNGGGKVHPQMV